MYSKWVSGRTLTVVQGVAIHMMFLPLHSYYTVRDDHALSDERRLTFIGVLGCLPWHACICASVVLRAIEFTTLLEDGNALRSGCRDLNTMRAVFIT